MRKEIVDIFDISYEGSGVGKISGKVAFVPKTLIGEKVLVELRKENENFVQAELKDVLVSSEMRILPKCPYFQVCGGCDFQHCDYDEELTIKKEILNRELNKAGFDGDIKVFKCSDRYNYRNKIKFDVLSLDKIGFYKAKSKEFFEVDECPIACSSINKIIPIVKDFLIANKFKDLKSVYIKSLNENPAVCFLFDKNSHFSSKNIKKLDIFDGFSVFFAYGDILESDKTKIFNVCGKEMLSKQYDKFFVEFDISAFNQVNDEIAQKLYERILENVKDKRAVNAYSGQGVLSLLMTESAKFVYGIEYQQSAHKSAEKLIAKINENKLENICGKVENVLPSVLMRDNINLIVLDPSREGCQKVVLETIIEGKIDEILYVSCNFSTLVRDLKLLKSAYTILKVEMFDMFPCTANMETLVFLKKNN